jgi:hypothetical protein
MLPALRHWPGSLPGLSKKPFNRETLKPEYITVSAHIEA